MVGTLAKGTQGLKVRVSPETQETVMLPVRLKAAVSLLT